MVRVRSWETFAMGVVLAMGCGDSTGASMGDTDPSEDGTSPTGSPSGTGPSSSADASATASATDSGGGACIPERCDGFDNDCDGQVDEDCGCVHAVVEECYGGPDGTHSQGVCSRGERRCNAGTWGSCVGEVRPAAEECDGLDNDCNGIADDACLLWSLTIDGVAETWDAAATPDGGIVLTGSVYGNADFGDGKNVPGFGDHDIYVAKYDADGVLVWANRWGSEEEEMGWGVDVSPDGSIFVGGGVREGVDFGDGPVSTNTMSQDVFVAKLDEDGGVQWVFVGGSEYYDEARALTVDDNGEATLVGDLGTVTNFGGSDLDPATGEIFVLHLDADGAHAWSRNGGGPREMDVVTTVAADSTGAVYVGGHYRGVGNFGGADLDAPAVEDFFVAKFDAAGNHVWSEAYGGSRSYGISIGMNDRVFLTGRASGTIDFGNGAVEGSGELVIASLEPNGTPRWAVRSDGGFNEDVAAGHGTAEAADAVYAVGFYDGRVEFAKADVLPFSDQQDAFLLRLTPAGQVVWGVPLKTPDVPGGDDIAWAIEIMDNGSIAVAGDYAGEMVLQVFGGG